MIELINTASKHSCTACESARILNSMVSSRDAQQDVRRTQLEQSSLLDLSQASGVRGCLLTLRCP